MLLPLIVFAGTTLVLFGLAMLLMRGGRNSHHEVLAGARRRPLLFGALTNALAGVLPITRAGREKLTRFLRHGGYYHRSALSEYLALRNVLVVGWGIFVLAGIVATSEPGEPWLFYWVVAGSIGLILCFAMPRLIIEATAKSRIQRIEESLPDALDMISMCMSGGLPLQHAMTRVSDEMTQSHPDLAFELRIVGRQMEAGSMDGAITKFANRIDTPEVKSLSAIISLTERQGASVSTAFEEFADNVRLARRQRAEEQGNKTTIKMLFPLVFCLAPPVYMMLLSPAVIELTNFLNRSDESGDFTSASPASISEMLPADFGGSAPSDSLIKR